MLYVNLLNKYPEFRPNSHSALHLSCFYFWAKSGLNAHTSLVWVMVSQGLALLASSAGWVFSLYIFFLFFFFSYLSPLLFLFVKKRLDTNFIGLIGPLNHTLINQSINHFFSLSSCISVVLWRLQYISSLLHKCLKLSLLIIYMIIFSFELTLVHFWQDKPYTLKSVAAVGRALLTIRICIL